LKPYKLQCHTTRVSGPPGTGKTTWLLDKVEELLAAGIPPERIIYTTFSRAGITEAITRATRRFGFSRERFPWFRTLHSLCFRFCRNRRVMTIGDLRELGGSIGLRFKKRASLNQNVFTGLGKGDHMLNLIQLARVQRGNLFELWRERAETRFPHFELEHLHNTLETYKRESGKIDYTDMLEQFLAEDVRLEADALIMDEAQDSSPLQWEVIHKLSGMVKNAYCVGDDDQNIFTWNGASKDHFIDLDPDENIVLRQSHRVPQVVHKMAVDLISRIGHRLPKEYQPRDELGEILRYDHIHKIDYSRNGSWLVLARNLTGLRGCVQAAHKYGTLYRSDGDFSIFGNAIEAATAWERLRAGETLTRDECLCAYSFMVSGLGVERGGKTALENADADEPVDLNDLLLSYGLRDPKPWDMHLSKLSEDERSYLRKAETNGTLARKPVVRITTIHGAKGLEADNVVLITDLSPACGKAWKAGEEEEIRVLYVALTRAKKRLFLMRPFGSMNYGI